MLPKKKVGFAKEPEKVQKVIINIHLKSLESVKYFVSTIYDNFSRPSFAMTRAWTGTRTSTTRWTGEL